MLLRGFESGSLYRLYLSSFPFACGSIGLSTAISPDQCLSIADNHVISCNNDVVTFETPIQELNDNFVIVIDSVSGDIDDI